VSSGSQTATYAYYPATGLLNTTTFTGGTQLVRSYDPLGRLQTIATTTPASGTVASYTYTYNNLDQRTRITREDNSYWSYAYNDRGELTSGKKYWSDSSAVAGQQTEYVFDSIGNRSSTKAGGDSQGLNLRQAAYSVNSLNQYQQRTVPGALDILGTANAAATVTVNDLPTYRRGDYFYKELAVDNSLAPAYPQVKAVGVRSGIGGAGEDAVTQMDGHIYVPKNVEVYGYDADGNLTSDGRWTYIWDAENRLSSMQAIAGVPVAGKLRLEFAYDYMGRRIQKKVYAWNVGTGTYQLQSTLKFVYDGWDLATELDGSGVLVRSYVRGGGELLLVNTSTNTYHVGSDGNQNVGVLVKTGVGTVSATYDYDPFGQTVKAVGEFASQNPIRFSSQYCDLETALIYYGYRYYNPQIGAWLTRDPLQEQGGINLRQFVFNDPLSTFDVLGLGTYKLFGKVPPHPPFDAGAGPHGAQKPTISDLAGFTAWNNIASAAEWVYPDAAKHMRHYLLNSGKTLEVDVQKMINDSERPRWYFFNEINDAMSSAEEFVDLNPRIKRMQLAGRWNQGENGKGDSGENWFYAVGGYSGAGYAEVQVLEDCKFSMNFTYNFADKYNWDRGKHAKILGHTVSDATLGRLHEVGLAHEFEMTGKAVKPVSWQRGQRYNSDGKISPIGSSR
jgi:RHS repeat-associated protein